MYCFMFSVVMALALIVLYYILNHTFVIFPVCEIRKLNWM
jgi:hypothetical protein